MCGSSCYDRSRGGIHPEVRETEQFERVGFPLGEEVVHFRVVFVIVEMSFMISSTWQSRDRSKNTIRSYLARVRTPLALREDRRG